MVTVMAPYLPPLNTYHSSVLVTTLAFEVTKLSGERSEDYVLSEQNAFTMALLSKIIHTYFD